MSVNGKLIVIEGLDGSGKATQTELLRAALELSGTPVRKLSFPDYDHPSSTLVKMYLAGEIGSLEEVNVYAASSFYAADRYISYATDWKKDRDEGKVLVADRYATSNYSYQMSKLPKEEWEDYCQWLEDFEYVRMGLPKPDLVLYLDMDPGVSKGLLLRRYGGDETKKDLHEANFDYLMRCREASLFAAEHEGWKVLRCSTSSDPLPIEMVSEQIMKEIGAFFARENG